MTEGSNVTFGRTGIAGKHDPLNPRARFSPLRDRTDGGGGADDSADDDSMEDSEDSEDEDESEDSSDSSGSAIKKKDGTAATQADFDRVQEALRKERAKNRKGRHRDDGETDSSDKSDDAAKARSDEAAKWRPVVVSQAARSALADAGLVLPDDSEDRRRAMKRALRLLDLEDVEIGDDGEVDGLEDAIGDLKDDYPELFTRKRSGGRIDGSDKDRGRQRDDNKPKTASEIQARQLQGKN